MSFQKFEELDAFLHETYGTGLEAVMIGGRIFDEILTDAVSKLPTEEDKAAVAQQAPTEILYTTSKGSQIIVKKSSRDIVAEKQELINKLQAEIDKITGKQEVVTDEQA